MVQPLQSGFESINKNMLEASYISGKGKCETIIKVALPNIKPALMTAIIVTFASYCWRVWSCINGRWKYPK